MTRHCSGLRVLLASSLAFFGSGCFDTYQKPRWDATSKTVLAIPFRELKDRNGWYTWSPRGRMIVHYMAEWVQTEWTSYLVDRSEAADLLEAVRHWRDEEIAPRDWARLTRDATFDYVLVGEIIDIRYSRARDLGFHRATARYRYYIYECGTGKRRYASGERTEEWPKRYETNLPISALDFDDDSKEQIERGLLKSLGESIGKDLYGYWQG